MNIQKTTNRITNTLRYRYLLITVVCITPALVLLPFLRSPVPTFPYVPVEFAGYWQSLSILHDGPLAYTYLTPEESQSSLHLHSLLSAPLLATGYIQAGRLISLLAAIASVYLVARFTTHYYSWQTGVLAGTLLWLHPLYIRFASRWWPESLGILLTVAAVLTLTKYYDTERAQAGRARWLTTHACVLLAITNHFWEATIALPLVVLALTHDDRRTAVSITLTTVVGVVAVRWLTSFKPTIHHLARAYSIFTNPSVVTSPTWFFRNYQHTYQHPYRIALVLTLPLATLMIGCLSVHWYRTRSARASVLASWLFSGLSVMVLLPRGWLYHGYYAWGLLAPMAITGAVVIHTLIRSVSTSLTWKTAATTVLVVGLLIFPVQYALMYELGTAGGRAPIDPTLDGYSQNELVDAGHELRAAGVNRASHVTFVGDWNYQTERTLYYQTRAVTRVLLYGGVMVYERDHGQKQSAGPSFAANISSVQNCTVMVVHQNESVAVHSCPQG